MDTISFLTDYGRVDEFVGVCKSVIRQLAPRVEVIDITHDIAPHDIRAGSLALVRSVQYLADGIVLAVVDPGVGTARKAIAVEAGPLVFMGPDNGLLAPAVAMVGGARRAVELTNDELHLSAPGGTFAGRDIFSPVAARLCTGTPFEQLGVEIDPAGLVPGVLPLSRVEDGIVHGETLWVDRFGNVQLNIDPGDIADIGTVLSITFGATTRTARVTETYADIRTGEIGLVVDSYGLVSVCLDRASAARELGLGEGAAVQLFAPTS